MVSLEAIREAVVDVARRNGAQRAVLFGSFARGTATPRSDVDVIFVEDTTDHFLDRLGRYIDPLLDRLGTAAEVFVYTPEEFRNMSNGPFVKRALAEGVVLYESGTQ
jgi:predicted nucleotidyltransferase